MCTLPNPTQRCVSAKTVQRKETRLIGSGILDTYEAAPHTPINAMPIPLKRWPSVTSLGSLVSGVIVELVNVMPPSVPLALDNGAVEAGKSDVGRAIRMTPRIDTKPAIC